MLRDFEIIVPLRGAVHDVFFIPVFLFHMGARNTAELVAYMSANTVSSFLASSPISVTLPCKKKEFAFIINMYL